MTTPNNQGHDAESQATHDGSGSSRGSGSGPLKSFVTATMRNCWVIDRTIRSQGLPLSGSLSNQLEGPWASPDEVYRDRRRGTGAGGAEVPGGAESAGGSGSDPPRLPLRIEASSVGVRGFAVVALTRGNDHHLPLGLKVIQIELPWML